MKPKSFHLFLAAGLFLLFASCQKNDPTNGNPITLEGGGELMIEKADVTKEFTLRVPNMASDDLVVALTTDATDGEALLGSEIATIKKGETFTTATITFKVAKFASGSTKEISVSTGDQSITYTVKANKESEAKKLCDISFGYVNYVVTRWFSVGKHTNIEHKAEISSQGKYTLQDKTKSNVIPVSEGDALSITMANINSASKDTYTAGAWVDWNRDGNLSNDEKVLLKTIVAGEHFNTKEPVAEKLKAPAETANGIYYMRIGTFIASNTTGGCGKAENGDLTDIAIDYKAAPSEEKAIVSVKSLDPSTFEVSDKDYICRINLSLDKAPSNEVRVDLKATSSTTLNGKLSTSSVVFGAGELSKTVTMTFSASEFLTPNDKATVTVTLECATADIDPTYKNVILDAKGVDRIRLSALYYSEWETFDGAVVIENKPNIEHPLKIGIKTKDNIKATAKTVFTPKITGMDASYYVIEATNNTIAIEKGASETSFFLYIRSKAIGKTMSLTFESKDADIVTEQQPITIEVLDRLPSPVLEDCKLSISINNSKTMTTFVNMANFMFEATSGSIPRLVTITPITTGDITTDDFSFVFNTDPMIISAKKNSVKIRFYDTIKGKKGTIGFTSPYATFAADGFITVDIPK